MSNLLKVAMIETIQSLRQRGWSNRRIARELGIDRETVARHLRQPPPPPTPANAPIGSTQADDDSKPAIAPIGSTAAFPSAAATPTTQESVVGRPSDCAPWRAVIQAKLA